jgi:opacity protein-like surface antigen
MYFVCYCIKIFFDNITSKNPKGNNMKKTLLLLTFLAVAGMSSTSAQAANHYVSGMVGTSSVNTMSFKEEPWNVFGEDYAGSDVKLNSGANFLGAIGCDYGHTRLEAELGYQKHDLSSAIDFAGTSRTIDGVSYDMKGTLSVTSLLANGYYDIDLGKKVELYATAGAGAAWISMRDIEEPGSQGYNLDASVFAWQVGVGLTAPVSDKVKIDLRYRHFSTADFTADYHTNFFANEASTTNVSTNSVLLGLRVDI